ncbi:hypothetical protein D9M68_638740 [compost metagenome]
MIGKSKRFIGFSYCRAKGKRSGRYRVYPDRHIDRIEFITGIRIAHNQTGRIRPGLGIYMAGRRGGRLSAIAKIPLIGDRIVAGVREVHCRMYTGTDVRKRIGIYKQVREINCFDHTVRVITGTRHSHFQFNAVWSRTGIGMHRRVCSCKGIAIAKIPYKCSTRSRSAVNTYRGIVELYFRIETTVDYRIRKISINCICAYGNGHITGIFRYTAFGIASDQTHGISARCCISMRRGLCSAEATVSKGPAP